MDRAQVYRLIETFYRQTYRDHVRICQARMNGSRHDAEDVVQEAFTNALQYWKGLDVVPEGHGMEQWFSGILLNCIRDKSKDNRNRGVHVQYDEEDVFVSLKPAALFKIEAEEIIQLMESKADRDCFILK